MGENSVENKLSREVLIPQQPSSGLGVMLVAATAMFFAVASSAFVLRARMAHRTCPSHTLRLAPPVRPVVPTTLPATAPTNITVPNADCGKPLYGKDKNGKASVYFTVCPPAGDSADMNTFNRASFDETRPELKVRKVVDGVQVHRVVR